jgi:hypothetical protein
MSELFAPQLAPQTFPAANATGDTGAKLDLSQLPTEMDGRATYLRSLDLRVTGTVHHNNGAGSQDINWSQLIAFVLLDIPGVRIIVNSVSGNRLARLFRERNYGQVPPFGTTGSGQNPWTGITGRITRNATNSVDITFPIEFSDVGQRRFDDNALPVALLQNAKFKVTFAKLTDLNADIDISTLTLTVTPRMYAKAEKKLGPLPVIESLDIVGTQPPISPWDGKLSHLFLQPTSDTVFPNGTDYVAAGLSFGKLRVTEDAEDTNVFYDGFNRYAVTAMPKHTQSQTDPTASLPFWYPPGGHQGEHATFEMVPAGANPRLKSTVAASNYSLVYRQLLDQRSPEMQKARQILGMTDVEDLVPHTASKKETMHAEVAAIVPVKDKG